MGAREQDPGCDGDTWVMRILCCAVLAVIAGLITAIVLACISTGPVYSVTVTGVAGLDPSVANPAASSLSPVFNLTVRIDNAGAQMDVACLGRLSTVSVSYQDALLARGSVPEFCAGTRKVRERGARAWGQGVVLPQFLRDQLAGELAAGEAAVDVRVTTPAKFYMDSDTVFVCSQAKIGGGPATCRKETVYNQQQANPGSTGGPWPTTYITPYAAD